METSGITKLQILIFIALIIALCMPLNRSMLRGEEPRRAVVSIEMDQSGQYVVPHLLGWNYYNKPPVFNWAIIGVARLTGSYAPWVIRLPSLLGLLLTSISLYYLSRSLLGNQLAILASLFLLTSGDILFFQTLVSGEIDLFFVGLVFLQVSAIFWGTINQNAKVLFMVSYSLAAIGVLTKGLPAIAFQGLTLLPWLLISGHWRLLLRWEHFAGILLFGLITGGYFGWYAIHADVRPFLVNLIKESSQRSALESKGLAIAGNVIYFPIRLISVLLPWSLLSIYLFSKKTWHYFMDQPLLKFCIVFISANIPLYWITHETKPRYVLIFIPFLILLLISAWNLHKKEWVRADRVIRIAFSILTFLAPPFILMAPWIFKDAIFPGVKLISALLAILSGIVAQNAVKNRAALIYLFMLNLVLVRISYNLCILPSIESHSNVQKNMNVIEDLFQATNGEKFALTGLPVSTQTKVSFGPLGSLDTQMNIPPDISYIIPYYHYLKTGEIMAFEDKMISNRNYLAFEGQALPLEVDTLYRFKEVSTKKNMILVRAK